MRARFHPPAPPSLTSWQQLWTSGHNLLVQFSSQKAMIASARLLCSLIFSRAGILYLYLVLVYVNRKSIGVGTHICKYRKKNVCTYLYSYLFSHNIKREQWVKLGSSRYFLIVFSTLSHYNIVLLSLSS